nr:PREDICTED: syntabulin [Opisthocomus hoazin]
MRCPENREQKTQLEKEISRSRIPRLVLRPQQKVSPSSESPFSEEESREFNPPGSSGGRTLSSNSFCSDDTGFPSSQSVSPVKSPSDAGNSPISFCTGSDGHFSRKKFSPGTMNEGNPQLARYKKETKTCLVKPGTEADFSSSSSTGSISAPEARVTAAGSQRSSFSRNKLKEREIEIAELKAQLGRTKEDWIEEQCKHVEGDLALNEARSKIKQLEQVIEAMKNNAVEKDQKIQKYFLDISIENKKLESLLQSMEMAQNSSAMDEQCLQYSCDAEGKPSALCAMMPGSLMAGDQALEEVADSRLLLSEDMPNGTDSAEESLSTAASEWSDPAPSSSAVKKEMLDSVADEKLTSSREEEKSSNVMVEQAVQTDVVPYSLDVEQLIQNIFRARDACPLSPPSSLKEMGEFCLGSFNDSGIIMDLTPSDPNSAILLSPVESPCRKVEHRVGENYFMKELDFTDPHDDEAFGYVNTCSEAGRKRRYWSSSLLRDVLAVAAPVVPTVLWGFQRGGIDPIYNIGALLRGCCLVALHSLRHTPFNVKT